MRGYQNIYTAIVLFEQSKCVDSIQYTRYKHSRMNIYIYYITPKSTLIKKNKKTKRATLKKNYERLSTLIKKKTSKRATLKRQMRGYQH